MTIALMMMVMVMEPTEPLGRAKSASNYSSFLFEPSSQAGREFTCQIVLFVIRVARQTDMIILNVSQR